MPHVPKPKIAKLLGIDASIRFHFPFVLVTTRRLRRACFNNLHVPAAEGAKYQMWERTVWYLCSVFTASIMPQVRVQCAATLSSCVLQCPPSFQASSSMPTSHGPQRPNLKNNSPECWPPRSIKMLGDRKQQCAWLDIRTWLNRLATGNAQ